MSNKTQKVQTIESLKMEALKVSHRYQLVLVAFAFGVLGVIGGHFLSIGIINDAQAKVVNSIEISAELKDQK